jgi:hypothetical protein
MATKTIKSSGGDYTSLSAWWATEGNGVDMVTATDGATAECYNDFTGGLNDQVTLSGATVDATYHAKITVAAGNRHDGLGFETGFFIWYSQYNGFVINNQQNYTELEWIEIKQTGSGSASALINAGYYGVIMTNVIGRTTYSAATGQGIYFRGGATAASKLRKSIGVGTSSYGIFAQDNVDVQDSIGVSGSSNGIFLWMTANQPTLYNSIGMTTSGVGIAVGNGTLSTGDSNAASDGSTNTPPGSNPYTTDVTSSDFSDSANGDYHLAAASGLIGSGYNLYSEFTTDIDGDTWPSSGAWDIGIDYYVSGGGPTGTVVTSLANDGGLAGNGGLAGPGGGLAG